VISVLDLRSKFDMATVEPNDETCIIVVESTHQNRRLSTGVIVDRVSEVVTIASENIQPPPQFGGSVETQFILGMGKIGEQVKILLDVEKILDFPELEVGYDDEIDGEALAA
ncbi:MAG: chemotaxis protein CheW, partial [Planctomycetota bacterium]